MYLILPKVHMHSKLCMYFLFFGHVISQLFKRALCTLHSHIFTQLLNQNECFKPWTTNQLIQLLVNQLPFVTIVVRNLTYQKIQLTMVISSQLNIQLTQVEHNPFTEFCCSVVVLQCHSCVLCVGGVHGGCSGAQHYE